MGFYVAKTKIHLREAPDLAANSTGTFLQEGEVFDVIEVVPPSEDGGTGFLNVGDRGWVFDEAAAGTEVEAPIVERVPEDEQMIMRTLFDDPKQLADYRNMMSQPDYKEQMQARYEELALEAEEPWVHDVITNLNKELEKYKTTEEALADPKFVDAMNEAASLAQSKQAIKSSRVSPRWMKLVSMDKLMQMHQKIEERDEAGERAAIREIVGGDFTLLRRPRTMGHRFGIRVPTVNSPL